MTDEEIQAHIAEQVRLAVALDATRAKLSVGVKLAKVLGAMPGVPKTGYNSHFKYEYRKADDVAQAVRKELAKQGLIIVPHMTSVEHHVRPATDSEGAIQRNPDGSPVMVISGMHTAHFVMQIIDGEGGGALEVQWQSEAQDTQDKGTGKAVTAAMKSFLIALFLIGDDEGDIEDDHTHAQAPAQAAQTRQERAAPARQPSAPRGAGAAHRAEGTGGDGKLDARQVRDVMKLAEDSGLDRKQLSNVVKHSKGGGEASGLLKNVLASRYQDVVAGIEDVARRMKEAQSNEETAAATEDPIAEPGTSCTCGAGEDAPAFSHDETCDLSIPFG